jgi:hypothetical protein
MAVGAAGGFLLGLLAWVHWLPALVLGLVVGSAALVGSGRHRDPTVQGVAAVAGLLAIVLAIIVESAISTPGGAADVMRQLLAVSYWEVVVPAMATMAGAVLRLHI